jgi:hypothetical protein
MPVKKKTTLEELFTPYNDRKQLFQTTDGQVFIREAHAKAHARSTKGEVKVLTNPKFAKQ